MNAWWMLFLAAVVLSPLAWLSPSRKQSAAMQARMQARRMGLSMQLSRQDWPHWLERSAPTSCAQYCRPRSQGRTESWCYWQAQPGQWLNQWREPCAEAAMLEQLQSLPADAYKVEAGRHMLEIGRASCRERVFRIV